MSNLLHYQSFFFQESKMDIIIQIYLNELRSLHTESEMFVRIFRTLKNKYDLTLCRAPDKKIK